MGIMGKKVRLPDNLNDVLYISTLPPFGKGYRGTNVILADFRAAGQMQGSIAFRQQVTQSCQGKRHRKGDQQQPEPALTALPQAHRLKIFL
jgi:hypothetical protein